MHDVKIKDKIDAYYLSSNTNCQQFSVSNGFKVVHYAFLIQLAFIWMKNSACHDSSNQSETQNYTIALHHLFWLQTYPQQYFQSVSGYIEQKGFSAQTNYGTLHIMATDSTTQVAANFEHCFLCTGLPSLPLTVYMTTTTNGIYQIFSFSIINAIQKCSAVPTSLKALKGTTHIIQVEGRDGQQQLIALPHSKWT